MAAALAMGLGSSVLESAQERLVELENDPWKTSSKWLIEMGFVMAVVGGGSWLVGSYLTQAAQNADKDAGNRIAFIGSQFNGAQAAASGVASGVSGAVNSTVNSVNAKVVSITYPGGIAVWWGVTDAPTAQITVTDPAGNTLYSGTGKLVDGHKASLADWIVFGLFTAEAGVTYTVDVVLTSGTQTIEAKYDTAFLDQTGILLTVVGSSVTTPNGNSYIDVTVKAGAGSTPTATSGPTSQSVTPQTVFGTVVGDFLGGIVGVGVAITEVPQAIVAGAEAFPYLLWDGAVATIGGFFGWLGTNLGPYLLGFGVLMIGIGIMLRYASDRIFPRVELAVNARSARFWNEFDRTHGTRANVQAVYTQKGTERMIAGANANPRFDRSRFDYEQDLEERQEGLRLARKEERVEREEARAGEDEEEPPAEPGSNTPAETEAEKSGGKSETPVPEPIQTPAPEPEPEKPLPLGTPTEEVEEELGGHHAEEPTAEELRQQELNRVESHPELTEAQKREAKEVAERAKAGKDGLSDEEYFAMVDAMRRPVLDAQNDTQMIGAADLQTSLIKEAERNRREAKALVKSLGSGKARKIHRGALEGMDRDYYAADL